MEYLVYLDIIGTIAFALSGYIIGAKANLDIMGIFLISLITSFGGGLIRDMLVDRTPFIFAETYPITVMVLTIIVAFLLKLHHNSKLTDNKVFIISDSIGLSVFAITGATVALTAGFNFSGVVLMALLTAVGGGVLRDISLNQVPYILTSEFYGTIAILIGMAIWAINHFWILDPFSINVVLVVGFIMRLYAIKYKWRLPKLVE